MPVWERELEEIMRGAFNLLSPLVLVVDNNSDIRDMLYWGLAFNGYRAEVAANDKEALSQVDRQLCRGNFPSFILLNLDIPGMDVASFRYQLRRRLRYKVPFPVVIAITADISRYDLAHMGVQGVLVKPFHVRKGENSLLRTIERAQAGLTESRAGKPRRLHAGDEPPYL